MAKNKSWPERLLPSYDNFDHFKDHITGASDVAGITMCMNKHLLAGATMNELLFLINRDRVALQRIGKKANDFQDEVRINRHIEWCRERNIIIEKNEHDVIRIVGYGDQPDSKVMAEFALQRGYNKFAINLLPKKDLERKKLVIPLDQDITLDDEVDHSIEGAVSYTTHRRRERDPELVKRKRQQALSEDPLLICEACGLSMHEKYGEHGQAFCEIHHRTPLFMLDDGETAETSLDDLAVLCPNCHRIIHRNRYDMLTVEMLKTIVDEQRNAQKDQDPSVETDKD